MYSIVDCTHLSNTVAIYCRLSEEDRDKADPNEDSGSIQNQKSMLIQYAISQGWDIYNIQSDDDYAGADRRRPEFNKLLADAEAKKPSQYNGGSAEPMDHNLRMTGFIEKRIEELRNKWRQK